MTFEDYDKLNPKIWEWFERYALQAINAGANRIGAKAIFERIRWQTYIERRDGATYKLNNIYTPDYARKFCNKYPHLADKFERRGRKSEKLKDFKDERK
jgi:hypothetical protein